MTAAEQALAEEVALLHVELAEARSANAALKRLYGQAPLSASPGAVHDERAETHDREQIFRAIFDCVNDGILLVDSKGVYVDANPAACALLGVAKQDLVGRRSEDFAAPGYDATLERQKIVAAGGCRGHFPVQRLDGSRRELEYNATRNVLPGLHLSVVRDVTEQKHAEQALRESEAKYRQIVDTAREGIWLIDAESRTTFVNRALEEMLGYEPGEMLGKSIYDFTDEEGRALSEQSLARRRSGVTDRQEQKHLRKDGSVLWVMMAASPLLDDAGKYVGALAMMTDVTDRRRAQDLLRASEERYRLLFERCPAALWLTDVETGRFLACNPAGASMLGYERHELLELSVRDLYSAEEFAKTRQTLAVAPGQVAQGVGRPLKKDGTPVQVDFTAQVVLLDGREVRLIIGQDLTLRNRLEARLAQARKLEAIGILAGGVAHDFNNLLSIILTYAAFAMEQLTPDDPARADVEQIAIAGDRAVKITRQLLAFSRQQVMQPEVMDLNATIRATAPLLRRIVGDTVQLSLVLDPSLGRIDADLGQMEQVLLHLASNARDAMPGGGTLSIETTSACSDSAPNGCSVGLEPRRYVRLKVSDTGEGISPADREHVFEPFFTTKVVGKGTGLGLSTVLGIVQQSSGRLELHSELGRGTVVDVYLPQVESDASLANAEDARNLAPLSSNEVLRLTLGSPP